MSAQSFKKIIQTISRGQSAVAGFYHRTANRAGTGKAVVATCRKVSMAFYNTIVHGQNYVEEGKKRYEQMLEEKEKAMLEKLAKKHNVTLSPNVAWNLVRQKSPLTGASVTSMPLNYDKKTGQKGLAHQKFKKCIKDNRKRAVAEEKSLTLSESASF